MNIAQLSAIKKAKPTLADEKHWTKAKYKEEYDRESRLVDALLSLLYTAVIQHEEDGAIIKAQQDTIALLSTATMNSACMCLSYRDDIVSYLRQRVWQAEQKRKPWYSRLVDWLIIRHAR